MDCRVRADMPILQGTVVAETTIRTDWQYTLTAPQHARWPRPWANLRRSEFLKDPKVLSTLLFNSPVFHIFPARHHLVGSLDGT